MKAHTTILVTLIWWILPAYAEEFAGLILLDLVSSTDESHDLRTTRRQIESHILFNCDQASAELKCTEKEMSVHRGNPRALAVWGFVTAKEKLTEKGRAAYKKMLTAECAEISSMKLETAVPNPEYVDLAQKLKRDVQRLKDVCASEDAAARVWARQLEDEAGTCYISTWGPYDFVFKQVGERKWIRSVRSDDLMTLTSGPLLKDGPGRGWTYIAEGSKNLDGKPWKYVYKGVQILYQESFEFLSLKECRKILVK